VVRDLGVEALGDFGHALMKTPTLSKLLSELQRLLPTQTTNVHIDAHPARGYVSFSHRFRSEAHPGQWQNCLYTLLCILKIVRLADPAWSPSDIWLHSAAKPTRFEAIESLGSTARFGQQSTGFLR